MQIAWRLGYTAHLMHLPVHLVLVFGVGFGMWASILNLVQNVNTYSAFAECYQCAGIIKTNQLNG